ncbi:hypothetical protein LCGC14_0504170 [marine sediment metagenome]|uniref:Uncharacterized protein n=1 Tax=marine sediment metagenome TaxID=412755 RepID=A0A0F9SLI2_9ZZZZ
MNSPIRWFGGKGILAPEIVKDFPTVESYDTYVEPFSGGWSVGFCLSAAKVEVYNDKDLLLVNFFRVLRNRSEEFIEKAQLIPYAREEFNQAKKIVKLKNYEAERLKTDEEKMNAALLFFTKIRMSMSGDIHGGWSRGITTTPIPNWLSAIARLPEIVIRFKNVQIESLDARACIRQYDSMKTLFYIDPPYVDTTRSSGGYRYDITSKYHADLLTTIKQCKGMVMLSGYHSALYTTELTESNGWYYKDIDTVNQAAGTTRRSGLTGDGALKDKQKRTETVWWNESVQQTKAQGDFFSALVLESNNLPRH